MKIEIVTTPNEALKETGFGALKACNSVLKSITRMGHAVALNVCKSVEDLKVIVEKKPDLVILAVKYLPIEGGDNIWLSEYFEQQEINFSGSLKATLQYDSDKVLAKSHLSSLGIKTARFFTAIPGQYTCEEELPVSFPLFLKPQDAANGNGIDDLSLVNSFAEYESKISSLYDLFNQPVLVEEYLDGQEFTVALINSRSIGLIAAVIEVIPPESENGLRILGEKAKKDDTETFRKNENSEIINKVRSLALDAFIQLGVRDFGRIDIKANSNGDCFFMEANLVPGMTYGSSYFPKACKIAYNLNYDRVVQLMLEESFNRAPSTLLPARDYTQDYIVPSAALSQIFLKRCNQLFNRR